MKWMRKKKKNNFARYKIKNIYKNIFLKRKNKKEKEKIKIVV